MQVYKRYWIHSVIAGRVGANENSLARFQKVLEIPCHSDKDWDNDNPVASF
jgi:hypothetical protein